jgi:hypothetical protein
MPVIDLAHLAHPSVEAANSAWEAHVLACRQCQEAPGPPPFECPAEQRELYACDEGIRLHEAVVQAAQDAYRDAHPEAFAPEPHDG